MKELSLPTRLYISAVILVGGALAFWQLRGLDFSNLWLVAFAVLAAITQVLKVEGPTGTSSYNISWLVYGFTLVLFGPAEAFFVILIAHLVEWVWHRYPWYIQIFNIGMFAVTVSVTGWVYARLISGPASYSLPGAIAIVASMAIFTLINHLMVGLVLRLARGESFSQSGVFGFLTLAIDFSLLSMGAIDALVWTVNPFASLLIIAPLYLIYSTLKVPALQRQTETDPKTGLFNARYFSRALDQELARADRFDRPMTIVLGDLDLLRNINNTYGHLAGDQVLVGIADILKNSVRDYDIVARFGGEEFAILMPETEPEDAYERVEEIRKAIDTAEYEVETSVVPIKATMSFGIAGRDRFGESSSDLIHNADLALYHAKLSGRNHTTIYSGNDLEELFKASQSQREDLRPPDSADIIQHDSERQTSPLPTQESVQSRPPIKDNFGGSPPRPGWQLNAFIGLMGLTAFGLFWMNYGAGSQVDWLTLAGFALIVLALEGLAVDIYVRDTSVSTSAAPFLAGVILTGPVGALVLSLVLAGTSMIKRHSPLKQFLFNTSNHMISSMLVLSLVAAAGAAFTELSGIIQISIAITGAGIMYLSSTILLAGVIHLNTSAPFREIWAERFRWLAVYYLAFGLMSYVILLSFEFGGLLGALIVTTPLFVLRYSQTQYLEHTKNLVKEVRTKNNELNNRAEEIAELNEELLGILSIMAEIRDPYQEGHTRLVTILSVRIAEALHLPATRIGLVRRASLLHDIGQVGIPEAILTKSGPLSPEEYISVRRHVQLGADIVRDSKRLRALTTIIRHHHEWFDGSGYPDGLAGHDIPLEARILAVADAFAAMTSDRPYRKAKPLFEIIHEFKLQAGSQFDPEVVEA
ncbi:MAG: diguanylate cyclase, partial [Anaerolineales bacterium]|nr:diguanylate cyclase [Anaerolineales bacterium]